jgi:hypothetical protein
MAQVLVIIDTPIQATNGQQYAAHVCGRETEKGLWEGWVEFYPEEVPVPLRTPRETTQPSRRALEYWATGLTVTYLEGALERAKRPATTHVRPSVVAPEPYYDGPAPHPPRAEAPPATSPASSPLDPFDAYAHQGEDILLNELGAMDEGHLRKIARAHRLAPEDQIARAPDRQSLMSLIMSGVRSHFQSRT